MVYNRPSSCLEKRRLIYSKQFDFRSHHSTVHAVLSIINKVQKAIEDRGGNTYQSSLQPLIVLQKKAIRIITFSSFYEHTSPLFKDLNVIKLFDEVTVHIDISSKFVCITFSQYCRNHLVNL